MMERMQNLLWYAFVLLLPWQTVWIVRETFVGGEKWQYATTGALCVGCGASRVRGIPVSRYASRDVWRGMFRDAIVWIFVALLAWSLLSIAWAMEKNMALLSAWRVLLAMLTYACARYGGVSFRKTLSRVSHFDDASGGTRDFAVGFAIRLRVEPSRHRRA
jgi:CubicO group peptidase (beta-lactamase class C family)